jgi:anaerobic selenocysteine-containing dehydrogenase
MLDAAGRGDLDVLWCAGGNFLETMPEPARMRAALERVPLRVHQDLFINTSMLAAPGEEVLLLPAQTRYEQKGGGTLTSTERRIRFSPEIPGPRIGEAMAEWQIFMRAAQGALPLEKRALIQFDSAEAVRSEMERCIPMYKGIGALQEEGDSVQYGGALLCAGGVCANMPDGRARFTALHSPDLATFQEQKRDATPNRPAIFYLTTRRGKQFNSMIWDERDSITGAARRDEIFIAPEDAARLGLRNGDAVMLRAASEKSEVGSKKSEAEAPTSNLRPPTSVFRGTVRMAPVKSGTLQAFWPEANVLIPSRLDPASHEPDYNAWVFLEKC